MTKHSFLTAFSPIDHRPDDPDGRAETIRRTLAEHEQGNSPFQDCPMVHMARLQIFDHLTPAMGDMSGKDLKSRYVMFVVDLDGQVDDFLDHFYRVHPDFIRNVWGQCLAYPDYEGAVFFRRFINRCMFHKPLAYAGFPASVEEILRALTQKQNLANWARKHQGKTDAALQKAWRKDREQFTNPDIPRPGNI